MNRNSTWRLTIVCVSACFLASSTASIGQGATAGLRIVVIDGQDAVNVVPQGTVAAPVVEVRDLNDQPVAGAQVRFAIQGALNATLAGDPRTLLAATDAAGRAQLVGLTPTRSGVVRIDVTATFQGLTATATINQRNFATLAEASVASASGTQASSAGAGSSRAFALVGAAASVAGGAILSSRALAGITTSSTTSASAETGGGAPAGSGSNRPPTISAIAASSALALQGVPLTFEAQASDPNIDDLTYAWDFGDGDAIAGRGIPAIVQHAFNTTGTFIVRLLVSDARLTATSQTTVTIRSLTGRWVGTWTCFKCNLPGTPQAFDYVANVTINAVQNGNTVTSTASEQIVNSVSHTCSFSNGFVGGGTIVSLGQGTGTCSGPFPVSFIRGYTGTLDGSLNRIELAAPDSFFFVNRQ